MQQELSANLSLLNINQKSTEFILIQLGKRLDPDFKHINRVDLNLKLSKLLNQLGFKIRKSDLDVKPRLDKIILEITNLLLEREIEALIAQDSNQADISDNNQSITTVKVDENLIDAREYPTNPSLEDLESLRNEIDLEQNEYETVKLRLKELIESTGNVDIQEIMESIEGLNAELNTLESKLEFWQEWYEFGSKCERIDYAKYTKLVLDGANLELDLEPNSICNNVDIYKRGILDVELYLDAFIKVYSSL